MDMTCLFLWHVLDFPCEFMIVITIPSAATTSTIIEHLLYLNMCYRITSFPHKNLMEFGQSFPFLISEYWAINGLTILLKIKQAVKAEPGH